MGCVRVSGFFQRDDFRVPEKSGADKRSATLEADWRAGDCRHADFHFVFRKRARGNSRTTGRRYPYDAVLAFLAALVSTSIFSFLLRGAGVSRSFGQSELAGCETDCVRSLDVWRSSRGMGGTIRNAHPQRFFPT